MMRCPDARSLALGIPQCRPLSGSESHARGVHAEDLCIQWGGGFTRGFVCTVVWGVHSGLSCPTSRDIAIISL